MFVYISFFFFKQKTAYEMRISDWSSDVCSSDLQCGGSFDQCDRCAGVQKTSGSHIGFHPELRRHACKKEIAEWLTIGASLSRSSAKIRQRPGVSPAWSG